MAGTQPSTLSLNSIVDVVIEIAPQLPARPTFNIALFTGTSPYIPSNSGNSSTDRIRLYDQNYEQEMTADGFQTNSPEYIAASLYFGASPAPNYLYVGRQDLTALTAFVPGTMSSGGSPALVPSANGTGANYAVGDIVQLATPSGGYPAQATITGVGTGGTVSSLQRVLGNAGSGYSVSNSTGTTTISGNGTGLTVNVLAVGETAAEALQVCRNVNFMWYAGVATAAKSIANSTDGIAYGDHAQCAAWAQSAQPSSVYCYTTKDSAVLSGANATTNILAYLKSLNYNRALGQYATTQNGLYPDNVYAICAILGYAMGQNTGLQNSAYTLKFKGETGIATEPLSLPQISSIEGNNGNLYLSYGQAYNFFEQGVMANGQFFDEILNLDMLANDMQLNLVDLLYSVPKVPQTDAGASQEIQAANLACYDALLRGFLGPGVYTGVPILNLATGQALPNGYIVQAPAYSTQSPSDRQARKSVPLYVVILEAGAVHSIVVQVNVQR